MFQGQRSEGGGLVEASDATNIFCLYYFCIFYFGFLQNCLVFMFQGQSRQCGGWVEASDATNAAKLLGENIDKCILMVDKYISYFDEEVSYFDKYLACFDKASHNFLFGVKCKNIPLWQFFFFLVAIYQCISALGSV